MDGPFLLLLAHGDLARGLKRSAEMICGARDDLVALGLRPTDSPDSFLSRVKNAVRKVPLHREILVLADLYGGTPANVAARLLLEMRERVACVTGVNLPMLLAVLTAGPSSLTALADLARQEGAAGIVDMWERLQTREAEA